MSNVFDYYNHFSAIEYSDKKVSCGLEKRFIGDDISASDLRVIHYPTLFIYF